MDTASQGTHVEYPEVLLDDVQRLMNIVQVLQGLSLGIGFYEALDQPSKIDCDMCRRDAKPVGARYGHKL